MKAYGYDEKGYYIGEKQCQLDPLESKAQNKSVYLIPGNATLQVPPEEQDGYRVRFVAGKWELEKIPEPEPAPEPTEQDKIRMEIEELKYKLSSSDYAILKIVECRSEEDKTAMFAKYGSVIENRKSWRVRINELEKQLGES